MNTNLEILKTHIQTLLGKEITRFVLKGKGAVNYAYYVETGDGKKYVVKQEREIKEFEPQNSLGVEATVAQHLCNLGLATPTPRVVFISENPVVYGYEYVEGDMMRTVWGSFSEDEKTALCRTLGIFHAEIGKKFTKEMARDIGIKIDMSMGLHPEVQEEYNRLVVDATVPEKFRILVQKAKAIFDETLSGGVFQFIHNDAHHENVIVKDTKISGIIDFGNAEYGEIAKEFSRYIRDYPDYFQYIVSEYEKESGHKLSYQRLVSNALLSGFAEIVEDYQKGGDNRSTAEKLVAKYEVLLGI